MGFLIMVVVGIIVMFEIIGKTRGESHVNRQQNKHYQAVYFIKLMGLDYREINQNSCQRFSKK